jgi:hypothetical protein
LVLTNTTSSPCVIQGYAGVSFVTGTSGRQVGNPAERVTGAAPNVLLTKGESASELLQVVDAYNYPDSRCHVTDTLGFRVYPPDQRTALFVPHHDVGCASTSVTTLSIQPFVAGV